MLVKFLQDYNGYQKKGEILDVHKPLAEMLIKEGVCEIAQNEPVKVKKNKSK